MAATTSRASSGAARTATTAITAALILALAALAPVGAAATTEVADRVTADLLAQAQAGHAVSAVGWSTPISAAQAAPDNDCFADAEGDTYRFGDPPVPAEQPRADIRQHCANYGATLSLALTPEVPTDPASDRNWDGATFAGWFIDINNDREGEFFAAFHLDTDRNLVGEVIDIRGDNPALSCSGAATATATTYSISDIGPGCIAEASTIRVSPALWYDTRPRQGSNGARFYDVDPDGQDPENPSEFLGPTSGGEDRPTDRYGGQNRIETAVAISQAQFPVAPVDVVFIARHDLFADAVTGGVLTAGPILLLESCGPIPTVVRAEIARLDPDIVIALGREQAVCEPTLLAAGEGRATDRLGGETRVGTSVRISQYQFPDDADHVYIARSDVFADAVVGGVLTRGPILLASPCGDDGTPAVSEQVRTEVERLDPDEVIALGGPVAVCDANLAMAAQGRTIGRLAGPTRIETAIEISRFQFPGTAPILYLARDGRPTMPGGEDNLFADAAVGGTLTGGPILLVPTCGEFPPAVGVEISRVAPARLIGLGLEAAICPEMLEQAARH